MSSRKTKKINKARKSKKGEQQKVVGPLVGVYSEEEYEVESIVKHVEIDGRKFYFVKWKNYTDFCNTPEPAENLENCKELIDEYHARLEAAEEAEKEIKVYM